jgi:polysaccharide export outer membrane protein
MSLIRPVRNLALCLGLLALTAAAQLPNLPAPAPSTPAPDNSAYVLGPGDQISVFVEDLPEEFTNKTFRVDTNGELSLPAIGHIQAGGLSIAQLEADSKSRLAHILKDPQVAISVVNFGSQPISILGAVNSPGIRQLEGRKTLFEILSASGGLRADAGYQVKITRSLKWGAIPLPQAHIDATGESSVAAINLNDIINATDPAQNIAILPGDAISVPKAELIYVIGSVGRPGGFALNEHKSLSTLQAVSLAEGLGKTAASDRARILRTVAGSPTRIEIAVNLKKLMNGKIPDIQLEPNDILFVPTSGAKVAESRTIDVMAGAASAAIWKF